MNTQPIVTFESQEFDSVATVAAESIVANDTIHEFREKLLDYAGAHPGAVLHLDLSNVQWFSCTALSDLLQLQQELHRTNGALRLCGVHGNVRKIMKLTGLGKAFTLEHRHAH